MVDSAVQARTLAAEAGSYLKASLGISAQLRAWPRAAGLPRVLRDSFEIHELRILRRPVLLAVDKRRGGERLATARDQVEKLSHTSGIPVIYVSRALASYERRRLIELKTPFLVPGNQLYLPDLGIDLREYFRHVRSGPLVRVSPATQAMLIFCLLQLPWGGEWPLSKAARALGYSPMSVSRARKEVTEGGVGEMRSVRRLRWFSAAPEQQEAWEQAKPLLSSPVKRRVWVRPQGKVKADWRLAGLSALARTLGLPEPSQRTYAVSLHHWKRAEKGEVEQLSEPRPDAVELEIWSYDPVPLEASEAVDPLSLLLSLKDSGDEWVQRQLVKLDRWFRC